MIITTVDNKKSINVGGEDIFVSLCSTIFSLLKGSEAKIYLALGFLENGMCTFEKAHETARQFNHIRDMLSQFSPERIVYDKDDLKKHAPWEGKISPITTSCANFYTTAEGQDLLFEIVSILTYAGYAKTDVIIEK